MQIMPNSTVIPYKGVSPKLALGVLVCSGVRVIGDAHVGKDSSLWFNTVVRGDVNYVRIGERTNIQDNSVVHVEGGGSPCIIGNDVTVGHSAVVHACTVEDECLIGMGAVILDRALIRKGSIVGAGALVTQGKDFPPYSLIIGSPAKAVRTLTDEERQSVLQSAKHYVELAHEYFVK